MTRGEQATLYVAANATQLVEDTTPRRRHALLWGDTVANVAATADGKHVVGTAHGHTGLVPKADLGPDPLRLLEIYVIDVGQGDAILFRSPDGAWHLMDGGPPKGDSLLGEGARHFIAWKFGADLDIDDVRFRTVILSHSDEDHFGGLGEILRSDFPPDPRTGENRLRTSVECFLHAGIAKYGGDNALGVAGKEIPADRLLDGLESFTTPPRALAAHFRRFADAVAAVAPHDCRRVAFGGPVPGYDGARDGFAMHLLGPVPEPGGGLRSFGDPAHTVNGHSVVLRLDYGAVRILLTGDINAVAQRHLLGTVPAGEFRADVIKACHHGAEDIDPGFTKAVGPRVTVVSSGDNENYSHPRPSALGGYAYYGRRSFMTEAKTADAVQSPLVYATEIARSIRTEALVASGRDVTAIKDVVFGLVNVRTDGRKIVCAVRDELNDSFDVEELWASDDGQPADDR